MKQNLHCSLLAALALGVSTVSLLAQSPSPGGQQGLPDGPPPGHHEPPPSPLFRALDTNHDGVISADEMANAPAALKALADSSGQITRESLRPHHDGHDGPPPPPNDQARQQGPQGQQGQQGQGPQGQMRRHHGPPPQDMEDAPDSPAGPPDGQRGPGSRSQHRPQSDPAASPAASPQNGPGGPGGPHHGPPHHDPLFEALDTNHDGVISADEIAAAATSIKKADTNGDGQIDRQDMRPPGPPPGGEERK